MLRYRAYAQKLKLNIHFTKSSKRDIYKLCLWMPEEHNCLIITSWHVPKLTYRAHNSHDANSAKKYVDFVLS